MGNGRRAFLGAATSVISGSLVGCLGVLGSGSETNETNVTPTNVTGSGLEPPTSVETEFPQFQYDGANTGTVPEITGPTGAISTFFEFSGAGIDDGHQMGSPSLSDGTLYLTESASEENNRARTVVHAIDAVDGTSQWEAEYMNTTSAGQTAVTDDIVLTTVGSSVVGLDRSTGSHQWSVACGVESELTVADGAVYVVGTSGGPTQLYSLSVADGTIDWQTQVDADGTVATPAVDDDTVYTCGNGLQAFETETGEERWSVEYSAAVAPTVVEDRVVIGSEGAVRVFDSADGTELWSNDIEIGADDATATVSSSPAVADGTIYVVAEGTLSAYDLSSSQHQYTVRVGLDGAPVVVDGHVYLVGVSHLACLSASDGTTVWSYDTQQRTGSDDAAPAVADGVAYFPAEKLYAISD